MMSKHASTPARLRPLLAATALASLLAACGGGGGSAEEPPTPPPASNRAPVGAFTSATSTAAGEALALDAGGSTDADGDTLSYSWNFGDGSLGGGSRIAHVYATGGSYTVRLTVDRKSVV